MDSQVKIVQVDQVRNDKMIFVVLVRIFIIGINRVEQFFVTAVVRV